MRLVLASIGLGLATQGSILGVVTVAAAGRVSVTALGILLEPALIVAARVAVLTSNEPSVALFPFLHQGIATERLLWL